MLKRVRARRPARPWLVAADPYRPAATAIERFEELARVKVERVTADLDDPAIF